MNNKAVQRRILKFTNRSQLIFLLMVHKLINSVFLNMGLFLGCRLFFFTDNLPMMDKHTKVMDACFQSSLIKGLRSSQTGNISEPASTRAMRKPPSAAFSRSCMNRVLPTAEQRQELFTGLITAIRPGLRHRINAVLIWSAQWKPGFQLH